MSIEYPAGIKVVNPNPLDHYYSNNGTPYVDTDEANSLVPLAIRYLGLTVLVGNLEYWYRTGVADLDLELKTNEVQNQHYEHYQAVPAQTWNIQHNLGKHPSIHFEDGSGNQMIPEVVHIDENNAQGIFGNSSYTGRAYCN